ncbi:LLM class flavin-dependent oxidoreductase [Antrihabitans cavernicola]|uniref:LLM class flavin-dependent oxidoreductase n=1 Tax=Antrihabitans cavernicola TaxID=2495913 RepID=A0A5A7S1M0_9NOCA|nr:LLM class flavin-dependent oxidoreductase [Spelaeibacter cavernicola]KAA0017091.1 LLM class flavin-dependent oxidoreductase [Spelaeibacter cavernicola]
MSVPLSVLDLSPISEGSTARDALRNTLDLAQHTESWGYKRFWIAEHHFVATASSAPAVLIGLIAAATSSIRVGSAAVQVGHHTPASIVESFGTVDALYPGRIDLGLGRSGQRRAEALAAKKSAPPPETTRPTETREGVVIPPAFSPAGLLSSSRVAAAYSVLQQPGATAPDFAVVVDEIRSLLAGTYETADGVPLTAAPGTGADVDLWLFGSSGGQSAQLAGALGLPFVANYHVSPGTTIEAVESYRKAFRPSAAYPQPYLVVSADVVVADTDTEARRRASTFGQWVHSIRSGHGAVAYPNPDTATPLTAEQKHLVADRLDTQFVGAPDTVVERLSALQRLTAADELVITSVTHRHEDRLESHRLLARAWGLDGLRAD